MSASSLVSVLNKIKGKHPGASLLSLIFAAGSAIYLSTFKVLATGYVEECLPPPSFPWEHNKIWRSFDHAAIRRGFQVYNTIGTPCHSMNYRYYRQLIDVAFTEDEVKEIAAGYDDYLSEPDDTGEVTTRPGQINDRMHAPYKNDKEARDQNNGALPPDLSQIVRARDSGENYVFSIMTGYRDPPHGVTLGENMQYNLYFPGGQIAMPPALAEGAIEFEDGTECSVSQQAKDVAIYLTWASFMEHDERHLMGIKSLAAVIAFTLPFIWWKKFRWNYVKKRKVEFLRRQKEI